MKLSPAVEKYVLHWGEMGTRWGTNRTVAQIQALLYLSPEPLRADQIVDALSVARSNVSTSIRELQSYGLVRMTHVLGDRRDYFESLHDVWELFRVIIEQRKQRVERYKQHSSFDQDIAYKMQDERRWRVI